MVEDDQLILKLEKLTSVRFDNSECLTMKDKQSNIIGIFDRLAQIDISEMLPLTHIIDAVYIISKEGFGNHLSTADVIKNVTNHKIPISLYLK